MTAMGSSFGDPGVPDSSGGDGGNYTRSGTVNLQANTSQYQQQMGAAEQSTLRVSSAVGGLATKVDNLFKMGGRTLKLVAAGDVATLVGATAAVGNLQAQMSTLDATAAVNRTSMKAYGNDVDSVFSKFPSHQGEVVALITQITNLGIAGKNITAVAVATTKLGEASGESIPQLTADLVQLNRQMTGSGSANIGGMANAVLTVSKNAGVAVTPVLQFSQSIAPLARQAGIGEASVLGLSAAFVKAGADGLPAANLLNSMLSDITTLTRTGSPELEKYAGFLNMTTTAFKKLPAATQISDLFAQINKGGPQALNFVTQLGGSTRTISAVQAVAQGGGLNQYVQASINASGNTANLDRGSRAATAGLDAQITLIHNQLTRFVDLLGGPLLAPVTAVAHGFELLLSGVNNFAHALGPAITVISAVAAPVLGVAGVALAHAPLVAGIAAVRGLRNTGVGRAFNEGRLTSSAIGGGMSQAEAMAATSAGSVIAAGGDLPLRARGAFYAGRGVGTFFPGGAPGETAATGRSLIGRVLRAPLSAASWYTRSTTKGILLPDQQGYGREPYASSDLGAGAATTRRAAAEDAAAKAATSEATASTEAAAATQARVKASAETTVALERETTALGELTAGTAELAGAVTKQAAVIAGAPMRAAGMSGGSMMAGFAAMMGGQFVGNKISGNSQGGSARNIAGTAVSDAGMGAMIGSFIPGVGLVGGAAIGGLYGGIHSLLSKPSAPDTSRDITANLNPIQRYNQELGTTATNLAQFNVAVTSATSNLGKSPTGNLQQAATVTAGDRQRALTTKADPVLTALAAKSSTDTSGAVSYIQQLGLTAGGMDPTDLQGIKEKLIKAYGPAQAQKILSAYQTTGNALPNAQALGSLAAGTNNSDFKNIAGAAVTAINASAPPGSNNAQPQLAAFGKLVSSTGVTAGSKNANSLSALIASAYGIDPKSLTLGAGVKAGTPLSSQDLIIALANSGKTGAAALSNAGLSSTAIQQALVQGSQLSGAYGNAPGSARSTTLARQQVQMYLTGHPLATAFGSPATEQQVDLAHQGPLGAALAGNKAFTLASSTDQGNPAMTQQAIESAAAEALKLGKTSSAASSALQKLADNSSGAAQTLLQGAASWARTLQGEQMQGMSQAQQGMVLQGNLTASRAVAMAPGASSQSVQTYQADQQAMASWQSSQAQRLLSMGQALDQFHTQQERAEQSYGIQVSRTVRNYNLQIAQSEQDYTRQRARTLTDFNIQMTRQAQSAAESIYNPYARVQSQAVVNGGMLVGNLEDQNARISKQEAQVALLRKKGLSQAAIDTLQLDNPDNAQETNSIANSVINDPKTIAKINALIATRQKATTALTQSQYNEQFRNTVADFDKGLARTEQDYQTAMSRAALAQKTALGDMATDFNIMVTQSGQDMTVQMTELYGNLAEIFPKTLSKINADIGKQFPQLASLLIGEITSVEQAALSGASGGGPASPIGSSANPNMTPGTLGVNSSGKVGTYNSKGTFTPAPAGTPSTNLPHIAPAGTLMTEVYAAGFKGSAAEVMYAVVMAESGGHANEINDNPATGDLSYGLAQINMIGSLGPARRKQYGLGSNNDLLNPATNLRVAYSLSDHGTNFNPWTTYTRGTYRHFMPGNSQGGILKAAAYMEHGNGIYPTSEMNKPEAIVPLDQRGVDFMAGFVDKVSQAIAARFNTAGRGLAGMAGAGPVASSSTVYEDNRTFYTGPLMVGANDPLAMERALAARQRLKRLASPAIASNT